MIYLKALLELMLFGMAAGAAACLVGQWIQEKRNGKK